MTAVIYHNAKQAKKVAEMEIKKETRLDRVPLAAGEGFEPSHTESESAVLPLHNPAVS